MKKFLNRLSMRTKLISLSLVSVLGMLLMVLFLVNNQYQQSLEDRKAQIRSTVETATGVLLWAQQLEKDGKASLDQAQDMAMDAISAMRFGENEYFWIIDTQGTIIRHPINSDLNGKGPDVVKDINGVYITREAANTVRSQGSGFFNYVWPRPGQEKAVDKISYAQTYQPWGWILVSGLYVDDLRTDFLKNIAWISSAVVLLLVFIAWLTYIISGSVVGGIRHTMGVLNRIAHGDLSTQITIKGQDEVSQLLQSVQQMQSQFSQVVASVRNGSESLATASYEIAQGNQNLSARTESQASALQQTAASMEQLNATVQQNADNARQANDLAQNASTIATQGGDVVASVVNTMQDINSSSNQIADIIGVIDSIAFQTNILALNAAVEAARAGEQGRGFAVVAGEVRQLAQRSADAAKEIKTLIDASVERVESGTELADRAGKTMAEVVQSIQHVTHIVAEISSASSEQSQGVTQVNDAVSQMDETTQQNAALVEEMAAAAASLNNQAQELVNTVALFKLEDHATMHTIDQALTTATPKALGTKPKALTAG